MLERVWRDIASIVLCAALCIFISGCAKKKRAPRIPAPPAVGAVETGIASWYGNPYHGRRAANGEVYDMEKMTAAHRTLPFGTRVMVENQTNGKSVEVRITDRGPFVDGRIIDLSHAAAGQISMIGPGTAKVKVRVLGYGPAAGEPAFAVQVGTFRDKARADALMLELAKQYAPVSVVRRDGAPPTWRVLVGNKATREEAEVLAPALRRYSGDAFVVSLDP
jgi:rare lipoprotein A